MPHFTIGFKPDRPYYLTNQNAEVAIRADYLFGASSLVPLAADVFQAAGEGGGGVFAGGQAEFHREPAGEAVRLQSSEAGAVVEGEGTGTRAGLAIGQVNVGRVATVLRERPRDVLLLELHVVEVAQQAHPVGRARRLDDPHAVRLEIHVVRLLPRQRLQKDRHTSPGGVRRELRQCLREQTVLERVWRRLLYDLRELARSECRHLDHPRGPQRLRHPEPRPRELDPRPALLRIGSEQ